jgi:alpha-glucosidase (family GH31 glycosyl hydrolase)
MPPQALAALVTLIGVVPHGNRLELKLDHGAGELVWVTPSAFHFRRVLEGALPDATPPAQGPVEVEVEELPGQVRVRSKFVEVSIQKNGVLVRVRRLDGAPLMEDASEAQPSGAGVSWERSMRPESRYYGLGPRPEDAFDLRGKTAQPDEPFLYSTLGYGEYHAAKGAYRFDFTAGGRYRVHAPAIDYYFYYGPTIKQVFEEHNGVRGTAALWPVAADRFGSWATLRTALLRIVQGAVSAMIAPTFDLGPYANAPPELQQRARQLGSLVAEVSPGRLGISDFRKQLDSFYEVYAMEAHDKGFPVWHPLPFQFPDDPECARHVDEFMLGDEMLVAPIVAPGGSRDVYLPQGVWSNLETGEVLTGRRTVNISTAGLPVFARNGTIVPLDSAAGRALHYFPTLGAEFFFIEEEGWSQVHAAPAGDEMRLEIESKKARDYQWVVHNVERPKSVGFAGKAYPAVTGPLADKTWRYDAARKLLEVRVKVAAGEDSIVNLAWE